jgi:hypothetical protein
MPSDKTLASPNPVLQFSGLSIPGLVSEIHIEHFTRNETLGKGKGEVATMHN